MRGIIGLLAIALAGLLWAGPAATAPQAASAFRDCPDCPALMRVPAGRFAMGSPPGEAGRGAGEGPQHAVVIAAAFAIGRYDVTVAQYARFVATTGYQPEKPRCDWRAPTARGSPLAQRPDEPVVCVSWDDAQAYVAWLAARTGKPYRLPTEAEWEYAARAGSTTARPWGEAWDPDRANAGAEACCGGAISGGDRWLYTSPVGSFPANAFGLYDMIGDVWQWTADCAQSYEAAAGRPDCSRHAIRGGGWFHAPSVARSAARVFDQTDLRVTDIGFRVARTL